MAGSSKRRADRPLQRIEVMQDALTGWLRCLARRLHIGYCKFGDDGFFIFSFLENAGTISFINGSNF